MSIDFTAAARIEIVLTARDLKASHGERTANAFRRRLQATLERLAAAPESVALVDPPIDELSRLRVVPVAKFKARLVFYQKTDTGILVLHVLHAASDWQTTLGG